MRTQWGLEMCDRVSLGSTQAGPSDKLSDWGQGRKIGQMGDWLRGEGDRRQVMSKG